MEDVAAPPSPRKEQKAARAVESQAKAATPERRLYRIGAASVIVVLVVSWEIASLLNTGEVSPGHPYIPGWSSSSGTPSSGCPITGTAASA